jgi:hypothetical protein
MHTLKLSTLATVFGVFGLLAAAAPLKSQANTLHKIRYSGNQCVSSPNASAAVHDIYGVNNPSTVAGGMVVYCPMPLDPSGPTFNNLYHVGIGGYDRNQFTDITCNILSMHEGDGSIYNFGSFKTAGGGPGSGFTSAGLFLENLPSTSGILYLECNIPRVQSAGWVSHLSFYTLLYVTE